MSDVTVVLTDKGKETVRPWMEPSCPACINDTELSLLAELYVRGGKASLDGCKKFVSVDLATVLARLDAKGSIEVEYDEIEDML